MQKGGKDVTEAAKAAMRLSFTDELLTKVTWIGGSQEKTRLSGLTYHTFITGKANSIHIIYDVFSQTCG